MSALPLILLIALTLFVWAVAIFASLPEDEKEVPRQSEYDEEETPPSDRRKAA